MKHCKTRVRWVAAALVPVIAAAAWFFSSYGVFSGRVIPRRADVIDLRGSEISVQKAEALAAEHPGKTVLWDVPLSGGSRPSDAEDLEITALSLSDIPLFSCFPNLKSVDASGCADYEALLALRAACPALELTAFVSVGGKAVPMDAQRAVLRADTPLEELLDKLPFLPDLYRVSFAGGAVSYETQDALAAAFPALSFRWDVELLGRTASSAAKELSFAGSSLSERDVHTLCENLFRFPSLERIDLTGCGLAGEDFSNIENYLLHNPGVSDPYMCLADFDSYYATYNRALDDYDHRDLWTKKAITNIAKAGYFASDRSIKEYAENIWHIEPCKI